VTGLGQERVLLVAVPGPAEVGGEGEGLGLAAGDVGFGPMDGDGGDGGVEEVEHAVAVNEARDEGAGEDAVRVVRGGGPGAKGGRAIGPGDEVFGAGHAPGGVAGGGAAGVPLVAEDAFFEFGDVDGAAGVVHPGMRGNEMIEGAVGGEGDKIGGHGCSLTRLMDIRRERFGS